MGGNRYKQRFRLDNRKNRHTLTIQRARLASSPYIRHNTSDPKMPVRRVIKGIRSKYSYVKRKVLLNCARPRKKALKWSRNDINDCTYFMHRGMCSRGDRCEFRHDKSRIVICTKFLTGKCSGHKCMLSHHRDRLKIPTCSFHLSDVGCTQPAGKCPFLHPKRLIKPFKYCLDFPVGRCDNGESCTRVHSLYCPDKGLSCTRGNKCPFMHMKSKSTKLSQPYSFESDRRCSKRTHGDWEVGDDVIAVPPIHPTTTTTTKGRNNVKSAQTGRPMAFLVNGEFDIFPHIPSDPES